MTARAARIVRIAESAYRSGHDAGVGVCLSCGALEGETYCEPDAEHYPCSACGLHEVVGLEQALLMGRLEFTGERDPE